MLLKDSARTLSVPLGGDMQYLFSFQLHIILFMNHRPQGCLYEGEG